ncbi:MAG: hypothetical protein KJ626_03055 [Verrucomicrobia bacterium]|nr:hypothetical protein [Verrucomicrobiota bacterium]
MLRVPQTSRETIDNWSVSASGLPVRVINSLRSVDVKSIGELRRWKDSELIKLRSLGRISLGHIHRFFNTCNRISAGKFSVLNIRELLDIFLDSDELHVLTERYGLERADYRASRNYMTLQQIANQGNRTRERVRQVEETAKSELIRELARLCFQPLIEWFRDFTVEQGEIISPADLAVLQHDEFFTGYNPCSVLLLMCDLHLDRIIYRHGVFSTRPADQLKLIENAAVKFLKERSGLSPLLEVADTIRAFLPKCAESKQNRATSVVLDTLPDVGATVDGRYFIFDQDFDALLQEVMSSLPLPAHYTTATHRLNELLKSHCRKGSGYVLKALNLSQSYTRVERGVYTLV